MIRKCTLFTKVYWNFICSRTSKFSDLKINLGNEVSQQRKALLIMNNHYILFLIQIGVNLILHFAKSGSILVQSVRHEWKKFCFISIFLQQ